MAGAFIEFEDLPLYFDAVTSENTDAGAKATEHPVEEGANVSDHVRDELDKVTLEIFVSNQPIKDVNGLFGLDRSHFEILDVQGGKEAVLAGKNLDVPKYRPIPVTPGALMQTISTAVGDLLSDATVAQLYGQTEPKQITATAQVQAWGTKFNQVTTIVDYLNDWKSRGVLGKVIMPWKTFPSMIIEKVATRRDAQIGDGAVISLALKEIRLVESKLVTAPVPTEPRGSTAKPKGRQPTSFVREPTAPKKSVLAKLTGG